MAHLAENIKVTLKYIENNFDLQKTIEALKIGPLAIMKAMKSAESQRLLKMFRETEAEFMRSVRKRYIDNLFKVIESEKTLQKTGMSKTRAFELLGDVCCFTPSIQVAYQQNNYSLNNINSELKPEELLDSRIADVNQK